MEINIDNAFINAIKLTMGPCLVKYHKITESTLNISKILIYYFLSKPFFTTLLGFVLVLFIITTLFIAFITIIGILFSFLIILLIEGFLLITCLGMICILIMFVNFITIALFELKYVILKK